MKLNYDEIMERAKKIKKQKELLPFILNLADDCVYLLQALVEAINASNGPEKAKRDGPCKAPDSVYACGYEREPGSFSMFAGPTPNLKKLMANHDGMGGPKACVIRFDPDGTETVVRRWSKKKNRWMALPNESR